MNEIQNMDFYMFGTTVMWCVEVVAYSVLCVFGRDIVEVALEPLHQFSFCLANILSLAYLACDAVYEVTAFAVDSNFCREASFCKSTYDST